MIPCFVIHLRNDTNFALRDYAAKIPTIQAKDNKRATIEHCCAPQCLPTLENIARRAVLQRLGKAEGLSLFSAFRSFDKLKLINVHVVKGCRGRPWRFDVSRPNVDVEEEKSRRRLIHLPVAWFPDTMEGAFSSGVCKHCCLLESSLFVFPHLPSFWTFLQLFLRPGCDDLCSPSRWKASNRRTETAFSSNRQNYFSVISKFKIRSHGRSLSSFVTFIESKISRDLSGLNESAAQSGKWNESERSSFQNSGNIRKRSRPRKYYHFESTESFWSSNSKITFALQRKSLFVENYILSSLSLSLSMSMTLWVYQYADELFDIRRAMICMQAGCH